MMMKTHMTHLMEDPSSQRNACKCPRFSDTVRGGSERLLGKILRFGWKAHTRALVGASRSNPSVPQLWLMCTSCECGSGHWEYPVTVS